MGSSVWANISIPAGMIDDEVRKQLEEEGIKFADGIPQESQSYVEVTLENGILWLGNSETSYGEFTDLENLLILKGIPFERETGLDFGYYPVRRVFRPGEDGGAAFDHWFTLIDDEPVVSVKAIREVLSMGITGAVESYLNEHFPTYPPLSDYVKEV